MPQMLFSFPQLFIQECQTKFKEEMSNTKVRECNEECLQDPSWREDTCQCRDVTRTTKIKVPFLDCRLLKRKQCRSVLIGLVLVVSGSHHLVNLF